MKVFLAIVTLSAVCLYEVSGQSTVGPLISCTSDSDCSQYTGTYCGSYSQCMKCVCPSTGYVYDTSSTSCLETVNIGADCTSALQCPDQRGGTTAGGSCSSDTNKCVCDSGYTATTDNTACRLPYFGETCTTAVGCVSSSTMDCSSSTSKCECASNYPNVATDQQSCRQSYIDEDCTATSQCIAGTCPTTTCACPSTSSTSSDKQSCESQIIGGSCTADTDCITNAECPSATSLCACKSEFTQVSTSECRAPRFGQPCTTAAVCDTDFDPQLTCSTSCACDTGYTTTGITVPCAKTNIGSACVVADNTCGTDATCPADTLVCTCATDYTTNTNGYDCDAPVYGSDCTVDDTCTGTDVSATCTGNKCVCITNRYPDTSSPGNCRTGILGETCATAADCSTSITSVECSGSSLVCACPSTMKEDNGNCRRATYNEDCGTIECDTGYTCTDSKCACATDDVYDTTITQCRNSAAVVSAQDGAECTNPSTTVDWTGTNPIYKRCDTSLTGDAALTCMDCNSDSSYKCNTVVQDPSGSVTSHASVLLVLSAVALTAFFKF